MVAVDLKGNLKQSFKEKKAAEPLQKYMKGYFAKKEYKDLK